MAVSKGVYSLYNGWLQKPEKSEIPDMPDISSEYSEYEAKAKACNTIEAIDNFIDDIYKLRQNSLLTDGEFGKGNLIFKELRNNNVLKDLKDKKTELENKEMSLGESMINESFERKVAEKELEADFDDLDIEEFSSDDDFIIMYLVNRNTDEGFKVVVRDPDYEDENNLSYQIYEAICDELDELELQGIDMKLGDRFDEDFIEEATEEDQKAKALADYLGISVEAVDQDDSDDDFYSTPEGDYLVYTDKEADDAAYNNIADLIDTEGIENIVSDEVLEDCINWDAVNYFIDTEIEYFEEQEGDQETANKLKEMDQHESLNYIKDLMGNRFGAWLQSSDAIDPVSIYVKCILNTGRGSFIANDNEEIELDNNLFAYRLD